MAKLEWGTKHTCQHCGVKYYDLQRKPAICPKCGAEFNPDALLRSRRSKPAVADKDEPDAKKPADVEASDEDTETDDEALAALGEEADDLVDGDDEDDELMEDASELGEDDEDMADVVVGDDDKDDT